MRKFFGLLLAVQLLVSVFFLLPILYRSTGEFFQSVKMTGEAKKIVIYGDFYRSLTEYLKTVPPRKNAVIINPPGKYAQYFWVLNYYFLPRKIYHVPDSLLTDAELMKTLNVTYSLFTRPDGFYFDRYPPLKSGSEQ
jgi:hypothetical protein